MNSETIRAALKEIAETEDPLEKALKLSGLVSSQAIEDCQVGGLLQVDIQRSVDFQTAFVNLVGAILSFQVAANFFDEIRGERIGIVREAKHHWRRARVGGLGR